MDYESIRTRIDKLVARINDIGGEVQEVYIGEPATPEQISKIEEQLGVKLPISFNKVLTEFSGNFSFRWYMPEDLVAPEEFKDIYCGMPKWSLELLTQFEEDRLGWIETVFPDPSDEYDAVWHNKLAFCDAENGDYLAFDMTKGDDAPIVYLSHDDGEGHGYVVANNFIELLENWSKVGFVGNIDHDWISFTTSSKSGILGDGEVAKRFRAWVKLDI